MLKQMGFLRDIQNRAGKTFSKLPLSPNQWTLISLFISIVGAVLIATGNLGYGLLLFSVAALSDAIDGAVARERNTQTKFGGFLDGVVDRFVEATFLFAFMFYPLPAVFIDPKIWISAVLFFGTSMVSFVRAYADHKEALTKEKALALGGICERSERLLILIIGLAAGILFSMDFFVLSMIFVVVLSIITIIQRMHATLE